MKRRGIPGIRFAHRWMALAVVVLVTSSASGFRLGARWTRTATDGTGIVLGDPITLTWGIVADGTPNAAEGPSDLISFLDTNFGAGPGGADLTQRPWFTYFDQSFQRWAEVSGLSYVYEPADDGATTSLNSNRGMLGVRADVRIAGSFIDGLGDADGDILAFNSFPNNGDMTIDTGNAAFYSDSFANFRPLRNVIMHEHGHGLGLNHVESSNRRYLMEPSLDLNFDGPQFDDILGAQRGYGDAFEKSNGGAGNETASDAWELGLIADGGSVKIGRDGRTSIVASSEIDFVSIDDDSDTDYFSFEVGAPSQVTIDLEPVGPSYNEGPEGGAQSLLDTSELSDLNVALFDIDGTTLLASDNSGGLGQVDSISDFNLSAGEYFIRIQGAANNVQMYELEILADNTSASPDFNADGQLGCLDVDALVNALASASTDSSFDLNGDGVIDESDLSEWLTLAGATNNPSGGPFLPGDANLDGAVDLSDLHVFNENKESGFTPEWCSGDFDANGVINGADFDIWNGFRFQNSSDFATVVPEPASWWILMLVGLPMGILRRRSNP